MADESIELGYYGAVLRRHLVLIAIAGLAGATIAVGLLAGTTYTSSAEVLVRPVTGSAAADPVEINTSTEERIATSSIVARLAAQALGEDDAESLADDLDIEVPIDSQILVFEYTSSDPEVAQARAGAFAEAYLQLRGETAAGARDERVDTLSDEIVELTEQLAATTQVLNDPSADDVAVASADARRQLLLSEIDVRNSSVARLRELPVDPGEVTTPASVPKAARTSPLLLLLVGGAVGAVAGTVWAFIRDRLRARVFTSGDVEVELGTPVLATIPGVARPSAVMVTRTDPHSPAAHAYRRLAVTLLSGHERPPRSVLIVSATKHEPRTAVALNLAVALLQQGRRVLLVSADRYDPKIDRTFGLESAPGLDDYLAGKGTTEPQEVLHHLHVLPAGSGAAFPVHHVPPRAAVAGVLDRGARLADVVLVDAPPALDYPDAEVIGPIVDAVLIVAAAELTSRSQLADLRARLALVSAPVRGAVLVGNPSLGERIIMHLRTRADAARASSAATALPMEPEGDEVRSWGAAPTRADRAREPEAAPRPDTGPAPEAAPAAVAASPPADPHDPHDPLDDPDHDAPADVSADAAALRDRIDRMLRRHTISGLPRDLGDRSPNGHVSDDEDATLGEPPA